MQRSCRNNNVIMVRYATVAKCINDSQKPRTSTIGHAAILYAACVLCRFHLDYMDVFCILWKKKSRQSASVCDM